MCKEVYLGLLLKTKLYMHKVKLSDTKQQTTKIVNYTIPELTQGWKIFIPTSQRVEHSIKIQGIYQRPRNQTLVVMLHWMKGYSKIFLTKIKINLKSSS